MSTSSARYREVIVTPLKGRQEGIYLLLAIAFICLLVSLRLYLLPEKTTPLLLAPYQRLDNTLSDQERMLYQALLSAQGEILYLWQEQQKKWPPVATLAEEGIPPFNDELLPQAIKGYSWKEYDRGPWVDYIGNKPDGSNDDPSILLRIIDLHADFHPHPHPGKDYDPLQQTATQIWFHPVNKQKYPGMQLAERKWAWIISPKDPILKLPGSPAESE